MSSPQASPDTAYMIAREQGRTPDEAAADAAQHLEAARQ
jgi:hypothetical protein